MTCASCRHSFLFWADIAMFFRTVNESITKRRLWFAVVLRAEKTTNFPLPDTQYPKLFSVTVSSNVVRYNLHRTRRRDNCPDQRLPHYISLFICQNTLKLWFKNCVCFLAWYHFVKQKIGISSINFMNKTEKVPLLLFQKMLLFYDLNFNTFSPTFLEFLNMY